MIFRLLLVRRQPNRAATLTFLYRYGPAQSGPSDPYSVGTDDPNPTLTQKEANYPPTAP
jgi:hypothetical protein